jgi:hypothetical protein
MTHSKGKNGQQLSLRNPRCWAYFKSTLLNILKKPKEAFDKELKCTRKMLYEQNENINQEIKILKRNQTEVLGLESIINRSSGTVKYNNWNSKIHKTLSTADLSKLKKEPANVKTGRVSLSNLKNREEI